MNSANRFVAVFVSLFLLVIIFELVRRRKLKERYALLWLVTGVVILILTVFPDLLDRVTRLFGIALPINTLFFFGIFFIILINLHFSVVISSLTEQNKKIAQKIALFELKIKNDEG